MLPAAHRRKLRRGRIIQADVPNSLGTGSKVRYAVMIDSDGEIEDAKKADRTYYVAPISHNQSIDPTYLVPVPMRTGLTGNIVCSWLPNIHEDKIEFFRRSVVNVVLTDDELKPIFAMIQKYSKDKAAELGRVQE